MYSRAFPCARTYGGITRKVSFADDKREREKGRALILHARPGKAFYDNRDVIAARDPEQCDVNIDEDEGREEVMRTQRLWIGNRVYSSVWPEEKERKREVIGPHTKRTHGKNNREA